MLFSECIQDLQTQLQACKNRWLHQVEENILKTVEEDAKTQVMWMVPKVVFARKLHQWIVTNKKLQFLKPELFIGVQQEGM